LFEGPFTLNGVDSRAYDVSPDGERFLMIRDETTQSLTNHLNVVVNWHEELRRLVPSK
jgi:hypothetical protein